MEKMSPRLRLWLCVGVIILSAIYAVLVTKDRRLAEAVALGYICIVLTVLLVVNLWKHT
jgi:tryptophan-rich sensory protein